MSVCVPRGTQFPDAWTCIDELGWHLETGGAPPYIAPRVQAALGVGICEDARPPDILLIESERASLLRFTRAALARPSVSVRGCEAVLARANAGMLGGSPR